MSISGWIRNFIGIKPTSVEGTSYPMAKEADLKSPRSWFAELSGEPAPLKKEPKFIHVEKRQISKPTTEDQDLSKILEEALKEEKTDLKTD